MVEDLLAGWKLKREVAAAILACRDERIGEPPKVTLRVCARLRSAGASRVCVLRHAQSGVCPEDYGYCS